MNAAVWSTIIASVSATVVGCGGAYLNHLFSRKRSEAETAKLMAETDRIRAELSGQEESRKHDRALCGRSEAILPESRLRDGLNGPLYNRRTSFRFTRELRNVLDLAGLEDGKYLSSVVQVSFSIYLRRANELRDFIGTHTFSPVTMRRCGTMRTTVA